MPHRKKEVVFREELHCKDCACCPEVIVDNAGNTTIEEEGMRSPRLTPEQLRHLLDIGPKILAEALNARAKNASKM